MNCGIPERPPPRWPAFAGRLILLVCIFLLAVTFWAGPASADCEVAGSLRTLSAHVTKADEKDCTPERTKRTADPISFAFFVGIIAAVLLVPIALGRSRLESEWADPSFRVGAPGEAERPEGDTALVLVKRDDPPPE